MNYTEKNKLIDSLCGIGLMFLLAELFYLIVDNSYAVFYDYNVVGMWVQIVGAVFLAIAIFVLVKAYKKDNMTNAVYGIELLVLAISAALLPGSYLTFPEPFNKLSKIFPIAFLIYYIVKFFVIVVKAKKGSNKPKGKKK